MLRTVRLGFLLAALPVISSARAQDAPPDPYGLAALWQGGDIVARMTLGILLLMSIATWYVIVRKALWQTIEGTRVRRAERRFWDAPTAPEAMATLPPGTAFGLLARAGQGASDHYEPTAGQIDRATWIAMALERGLATVAARAQGGMALLATVASTAPFVGLFGTVWGVYHALTAIGIAGQASLDKVAGPVGEALIMTAIGLATAVPAVLGYNLLTWRNKAALERARTYAADLEAALLFGRRVGTGRPAP